jgi:hypothetical protein
MFGIIDVAKMGSAAVAAGLVVYLVMKLIAVPAAFNEGRRAGAADMVAQVEKRNETAGIEARKAKQTVDGCYDAGGTWEQETGRCVQQ